MADIVDLNSRRPLPEPKEVLKTFDTIHEWIENGHARSFAVLVVTSDGELTTSYYASSPVDQFVIEPFLAIYQAIPDE